MKHGKIAERMAELRRDKRALPMKNVRDNHWPTHGFTCILWIPWWMV